MKWYELAIYFTVPEILLCRKFYLFIKIHRTLRLFHGRGLVEKSELLMHRQIVRFLTAKYVQATPRVCASREPIFL